MRAKAALKRMEMKAHSIAESSRDLFFFAHAVKAAWSDIVIIIIRLPAPVEGLGRVLIITNILIFYVESLIWVLPDVQVILGLHW